MIAVKNLYYLLLYAWDVFDESTMASVDVEPDTDLLNLLASVLVRELTAYFAAVSIEYLEITEEVAGIRGKCNLSATVKSNLLARGRTVCQFDELSYDVLHNQVLKATLRQLLCTEIDPKLRPAVRMAYLRLPQVRSIKLSRRVLNSVQLHRNTRSYRLLIDVCRLLFDHLIPIQGEGTFRFRDFTRDEQRMRKLFERFLFNFYKHEQSRFKVRRTRFRWANAGGPSVDLLPTMVTDITLECPGQFLVIDAKYSPNALQQPLHGSPTLRSGHLYQLFAYLKNLPAPPDSRVDGLIVYPLGMGAVDAAITLGGHRLRVCTVSLNQHWRLIRTDLPRWSYSLPINGTMLFAASVQDPTSGSRLPHWSLQAQSGAGELGLRTGPLDHAGAAIGIECDETMLGTFRTSIGPRLSEMAGVVL